MLSIDGAIGYSTSIFSLKREFSDGYMYGITGRNGCGKSTLLRTLAGEIVPRTGTVKLNGVETSSIKLVGEIVYIASPIYYPDMSIGEHLKLLAKTRKVSYSRTTEEWELSNLLDYSPSKVSSGQQQRFFLASQLAEEKSKLFLLDEPERHLDDFWIDKLSSRLRDKVSGGAIVILASHSRKILDLCDETIHLG